MISNRITSADLVELTGYTRHRLRNLLSDLPGYADRAGAQRVAREYTAEDLSVIAICCALEEQCGLRRDVISNLVSEIRRVLAVPRAVTTGARLVVTPNPPSARYIDDDTPANAGTVLPLSPLLQRIDHYLLGNLGVWSDPQRPLDLGPVSIACTGSSFTVHGKQPVRKTGKQHGAG